ncbi:X-linked retinitis pigmentosa GTPase regulator-interacting protein 1 [Pseudophryne corroboree]|uniref:X-linked retinitis pigmentosa GTPase regulator-interacting protein 1 n=1 Tax=Pseudophryne corroboree TaxID=495146 RepID=UPI0030816013
MLLLFHKRFVVFSFKVNMSLLDETSSDLPVKDTDCRPAVITAIQDVIKRSHSQRYLNQKSHRIKEKDLKTRYRVSLISRNELEDNYLRLHEENLLLKDYVRKQEDKIKRMATKLLHLTLDRGQQGEKRTLGTRKDGRDLEAEEAMEDLQDRVRDLERRNEALRHRMSTYKQRLQLLDGCRHCPYSAIIARTDSGVKKSALPDKYKKGLRVQGPETGTQRVAGDCTDARAEIDRLLQMFGRQSSTVDDRSVTLLKDLVTVKPKDLGTEMLSLQHMQQIEDQRATIQENVMTIRLQKELREKNTSLCALREQFQQLKESYETELQEKHKSLTLSHKAVLAQLEDLSSQLKEERDKVVEMAVDQQNTANLQRSLLECQERVCDLEKEKELIKENYENLLKSSLDSERVNSWKATEAELKAQITRLEGQNHCHVFDITQNKEQLQHEREQNIHLKLEISQLQYQLLEKMQEIHNLQDRVSTILSSAASKKVPCEQEMTSVQVCSMEDFRRMRGTSCGENGLLDEGRVRNKEKEGDNTMQRQTEPESDMGCADLQREKEEEERREMERERQRKMREMDAAHAETILELEKIREMLFLQHKINKDYQDELKAVKLKAECESREREEKERDIEARLLQRNSRIQILEAQLKDIAYGTYPVRLSTEDSPCSEVGVSAPSLHRGETLFEVNIGSICFTPYGVSIIEDPQPITFCIYSLYDFETHATPVVTGISPQYNFTSCYAVTPDPEFLRYLRVGTLTVELYQVIGGGHCELARGRLKLDSVLQTTDRVHSSITLNDASGENIGELDFWLRMHGPLSRSQCLQRQRSKAHSYLYTGRPGAAAKSRTSVVHSGLQNDLTIRIWGCRSLKVSSLGHQPSPYIVYRFYHHPDHSTTIIPCSNNPQFGDETVYTLQLTTDLERYLQREHLNVYVFDDEETQPGDYLGKAEVPLLSLTQGNRIHGDFALMNANGKCTGSVQMSLEWKFPYHCLWESTINDHITPGKDAPKIHLSRSRQTKSRKAEEDLHRDVACSKRGRRDPHVTDYPRVKDRERREASLPAGHLSDEMNVEDIAVEQEWQEGTRIQEVNVSDQETSSSHSDKQDRQTSPEATGDKSNDLGKLQTEDSDEEDIIVAEPLVPYKLPSTRIRVEVASLTLDPYSEVVGDKSVERVFVEFEFPGVPPEETETPLSLRKPRHGEEIYYHFSKVIHLDSEEHAGRRHFLYTLLEGSDTAGERVRLKFTVVSDPMNEDDECRDVGYAYLDLRYLLRRAVDPAEETLHILEASNPRKIIGALRVAIEAREAARAVQREGRMKTRGPSSHALLQTD